MDDLTKKLLAQCDDPMPGQRVNALGMLVEHFQKSDPKQSFCGLLHEFENAAQRYQDLETSFVALQATADQYVEANRGLDKQNGDLRRQIAAYKAALAIKLHPGRVVAWAAALAVAVGGYLWFTGEPANTSAAVAAAARVELTSKSSWADTGPKIFEVAGQPYWAIVHYNLETGRHADADGHPIDVECLHLYAARAVHDETRYNLIPNPYNWFGWLKWPERAVQCRLAGSQKTAMADAPRANPFDGLTLSRSAREAIPPLAAGAAPWKYKSSDQKELNWLIDHLDKRPQARRVIVDLRQGQGDRRSRAQHSPTAHGKAAP